MTTKAGSFRFRFGMCVRARFPVLNEPVRSHVRIWNKIDVVDELRRFGDSRDNFR